MNPAFQAPAAPAYGTLRARWAIIGLIVELLVLVGFLAAGERLSQCLHRQADAAVADMHMRLLADMGDLQFDTGDVHKVFASRLRYTPSAADWAACAKFIGAAALAYIALLTPIGYYHDYILRRRFGLAKGRAMTPLARQFVAIALRAVWVLAAGLLAWAVLAWPARGVEVALACSAVLGLMWLVAHLRKRCILRRANMEPEGIDLAPLRDFAARHGTGDIAFGTLPLSAFAREAQAGYSPRRHGPAIVYFSDNLAALLAPADILAVFAHELGHHACRKDRAQRWLARAIAAPVAAALLAAPVVSMAGASAPWQLARGLPLAILLAWLSLMAARPAMMAWSRRRERLANTWAMRNLDNPGQLLAAMRKLAHNNQLSPRPAFVERWLFGTHPPYDEIVAQARQVAAERGIELTYD